jgi:SOS response regulatory protein OraA/RecX
MKNKSYLLKYAIDYLSKFDTSKKNLERILKMKIQRASKDKKERFNLYSQIAYVLNELERNKLINDQNYTYNKIRLFASQAKSKKFIQYYLSQKGIEKKVIQDKLKDFKNDNYDWEKKSAFAFAKKRKLLETKENFEKKLGKMARAGFSYELCKQILKTD